jgi:DNA-binding SARP family transcriptional activator
MGDMAVSPKSIQLRLALVGGFMLTYREREVALPLASQRVVAFVALKHRAVPRAHVAWTLWPDVDEARASGSLRTAVYEIRRRRCNILQAQGRSLALAETMAVDIDRYLALASHAELHRPVDVGAIWDLAGAGDVLPDWDEEWVLSEREQFRQLRLHALDSACARLVDHARYNDAISVGLAMLGDDPLRETTQRTLVEAHLAEGNLGEAVRQYEIYRGQLSDRLRCSPSPAMERLISEALATAEG